MTSFPILYWLLIEQTRMHSIATKTGFFRDLPRNRMDRSTGKDARSCLARHHAFTGPVFGIIMQRNSNILSAFCICCDRHEEIIYQKHLSIHTIIGHAIYSIRKCSAYNLLLFITCPH